mgnify:CR=1 FL=1
MSDLRNILKEEYKKKEEVVTPQSLIEMIEQILDNSFLLVEEEAPADRSRTYTIKQIPLVPISELGWANNKDGQQGGTQRSLIEDWLKSIQGGTFQEKLNGVSDRMEKGFGEIPKTRDTKYIQEVMSYLVFIKTLTMAITNFNPSAAGFNFESFLAALMGGSQIAATGGDKTIADFVANIDGSPVPVSLKLYTKGSLEVGGSYFDLANDMINPNSQWASNPEYGGGGMMYIVCTKEFDKQEKGKEDPLARQGSIDFYQFVITRNNLFELLAGTSKKSNNCIASDRVFMEELKAWDKDHSLPEPSIQLPAKQERGKAEELVPMWEEYLSKNLVPALKKENYYSDEQLSALVGGLTDVYTQTLTSQDPTQPLRVLQLSAVDGNIRTYSQTLKNALSVNAEWAPRPGEITSLVKNFITPVFNSFKEEVLATQDIFGQAVKAKEWIYPEKGPTLIAWYGDLSAEAKAIAIKNTRGYLTHTKWLIPDAKARKLGGGEPFATLQIGAGHVQGLLDKVRSEIMDEVFSIFDNMAAMSDKLNAFFAHGLREEEKGEVKTGAEAGEEAAKTARKVAGVE